MDTKKLSEGTRGRLTRVMELKNFTEERALEFAISLAWQVAEQQTSKKKRK